MPVKAGISSREEHLLALVVRGACILMGVNLQEVKMPESSDSRTHQRFVHKSLFVLENFVQLK